MERSPPKYSNEITNLLELLIILKINFMARFRLLILIAFLLFGCYLLRAQGLQKGDSSYFARHFPKQESKSSLVFSGSFMHYIGIQNKLSVNYVRGLSGYYLYPLNAGLGIYYQYQIYKESYILSGINYQICHIASTESGILRFRYSEPSISVYLKHYFPKNERIGLFSTIGLSFGRMKLFASESHGHIAVWNDFGTKYLQNYSNDKSFVDIVFNTGVFFPSSHVEISPSVGYRVKDNWMGFYRHDLYYGLMVNYKFNL